MNDLISRADAIEAACNEMDWLDDGCVEERKTMIKDALSALPSADAVDVNDVTIHYKPYPSADAVQGEWTHDGSMWENRWVCDKCGHKIFERQTNFCPNCGAKMEGGGDE